MTGAGSAARRPRTCPISNRTDALAVLDALGIERAIVVGNSQGGQIAVDLAIESPDRVAGGGGGGRGRRRLRAGADPGRGRAVRRDGPTRGERRRRRHRGHRCDVWVDGPGQPSDRVSAHIRDAVREMDLGTSRPAACRRPGHPPGADRGRSPGRADRPRPGHRRATSTCRSWATAQYLAANAPNARAVLLPGVAHMIGMEAPAELAVSSGSWSRPCGILTDLGRTAPDDARSRRSPVLPPVTGWWEDMTARPGVPCRPVDRRRERGRHSMAHRSSDPERPRNGPTPQREVSPMSHIAVPARARLMLVVLSAVCLLGGAVPAAARAPYVRTSSISR